MVQSDGMTKIRRIWSKLRDKAYRDAYVAHSIGNRIAVQLYSMRSNREWTQDDLAEKTGMAQPRISVLEHSCADVSLKTLKRIAAAFDVALSVKFIPFSQLARETATETVDVDVPGFEADEIQRLEMTFFTSLPMAGFSHDTPLVATGSARRNIPAMSSGIPAMSSGAELSVVIMAASQDYQERLDA